MLQPAEAVVALPTPEGAPGDPKDQVVQGVRASVPAVPVAAPEPVDVEADVRAAAQLGPWIDAMRAAGDKLEREGDSLLFEASAQ